MITQADPPLTTRTVELRGEQIVIRIPLTFKNRGGRREIVAPDDNGAPASTPQQPLVQVLAQAHLWQRWLDDGTERSVAEVADRVGVHRSYVGRVLRLTALAPDIVEAILSGDEPSGLSVVTLLKAIPVGWGAQRELLGLPRINGRRRTLSD
jgi:hypothetical protein